MGSCVVMGQKKNHSSALACTCLKLSRLHVLFYFAFSHICLQSALTWSIVQYCMWLEEINFNGAGILKLFTSLCALLIELDDWHEWLNSPLVLNKEERKEVVSTDSNEVQWHVANIFTPLGFSHVFVNGWGLPALSSWYCCPEFPLISVL